MAINNNKIVAVATAIINKITSLIAEHNSSNSAHSSLFNNKVDKDGSKVLSTNDYTTAEKNKLAGIANGATNVSVDSALSSSSTNPVQNKKVKEALDDKVDKVSGKQLSTNDFTNAYKEKLDGIDAQLGNINMSWDALTGKPETFTPSAHTHGLLQNDGKITNVSSPTFDAGAKPLVRDVFGNLNITTFLTSWLVHNTALPNLGLQTGSTKNQKELNEAIDTALGNKISKSQTVGLVKNDGSIDTSTYLTQHQDISGKASQADLTALTSRVSALETSEFQIVFKASKSQLPAVGRANTLYYVANTDSNNENTYDEYTWISSDSRYELMGPRTINLSDYVQKSNTAGLLKNDGTIDTNSYLTESDADTEIEEYLTALTIALSPSYTGQMVYNYSDYEGYAITVDPQLYNNAIHMYVMELQSVYTANQFTTAEYNAKSLAYIQNATYDDYDIAITNSTLSNDIMDSAVYNWTPTSTYPTCYGATWVYGNEDMIYDALDNYMSSSYAFYLLIAWDDNGNPLDIEYTATDSMHMTATIKPHTT